MKSSILDHLSDHLVFVLTIIFYLPILLVKSIWGHCDTGGQEQVTQGSDHKTRSTTITIKYPTYLEVKTKVNTPKIADVAYTKGLIENNLFFI